MKKEINESEQLGIYLAQMHAHEDVMRTASKIMWAQRIVSILAIIISIIALIIK